MAAHSKLFSPSGAEGWFACAGRPVMEEGLPDNVDQEAWNGTARHLVCAAAITEGKEISAYVGREIVFWKHPESESEGECFRDEIGDNADPNLEILRTVEYDEDWEEEDQDYVDVARQIAGDQSIEVELKVDFSSFTKNDDPEDSFGHLDVSVLRPLGDSAYELVVMDRKTGRIEVRVERNKQLMLYALGRYQELELLHNITRVRLVIHQREAQEWDCSIEELLEFGNNDVPIAAARVREAVRDADKKETKEWRTLFLNQDPTIEACAHCRAMATCPSMQAAVQRAVEADFPTIVQVGDAKEFAPTDMSTAMRAVPIVEGWADAVKKRVKALLLEGQAVAEFKLVLGRQGNRAWKDVAKAEKYLKDSVRLKSDVLYTKKLLSPTAAEKLKKDKVLRDGQWERLQAHITRSPASPTVARADDKRDAYIPVDPTADFPTLPAQADTN